jgi:hypothetical protein
MPSFTFEKISPPVRRAAAAPTPKKPRGIISLVIERLADRRAQRALRPSKRGDGKQAK